MRRFINWFAHGLVRYRYGFLAVCIFLSIFFASQLRHLSFNTNLGDFYPLKHPYLNIQRQLNETFGGLNQVSIAIEVKEGDILNTRTLEKVWQITNELYLAPGINAGRIVSLSSRKIKHVEANEEGFVTERLMHDAPQTAEGLALLKSRILRNPLVYGPIVSKDFKATLIQADFESSVASRDIFKAMQALKNKFEDNNHKIYVSGQPILQGWLDFYLPKMAGLFIFTLIAMALVLYFAFKSKRGVILPLLSAIMATLWGLGLTAMLGYKLTPSTVLAPFLVFALGVSHCVQYIKRYYEYIGKHKSNSKAAAINITHTLFVPALVSLLTDGIGPLTLLIIPLGMIKGLAISIGLGVLSIFFSTVILVPNLLSFMKPPRRREIIREERPTFANRMLGFFSGLAVNKKSRWSVIGIFFALTFIALFGVTKLTVGDKNPGTSLLYKDSPYNIAEKFISDKFGASDSYYIFVKGDMSDALLNTGALREMDSLQRYLEKELNCVGRTLSLVEYIKGMNMAMFSGDRKEFRIPDSDRTVAEYLFLYSLTGFPGDFDPVVNPNYQYANIKVDLKDHKGSTITEVIRKTGAWIKANHKQKNIEFSYAGGDIGMLAAVNQIVATMLMENSLQTAFLVFLCLVFAYGSFVSGWLLIIPLIFRTVLLFGILGFLKVGLTAEMIPVVALGLGFGVDYGVYVLSRVKDELKEKKGVLEDAVVEAVATSGKAVFFTGLTLTVGIATWAFSSILMQARLGLILGFFILFNVFGTLIVSPSMIMTVRPKFLNR